MSVKSYASIPTDKAMVSVDYNFGDIRIMFKDKETIENLITDLQLLLLKED